MSSLDLDNLFDENTRYTKRYVLAKIQEKEFESFKRNWLQKINDLNRANGGRSKFPASMDKWVPYGQNQGIMPKFDPCGSHIGILAHVGPTWGPYRS